MGNLQGINQWLESQDTAKQTGNANWRKIDDRNPNKSAANTEMYAYSKKRLVGLP